MKEYFQNSIPQRAATNDNEKNLVGRKEVATLLQVSLLVILTDWMKRGLLYYKQRGRIYFIKSEVLEYIMENNPSKAKLLPMNEKG